MKKMIMFLIGILMSMSVSALGITTNSNEESVDFVVKQTISIKNENPIVVYYVKSGDVYKLYSEVDLLHQNTNKIPDITGTSFKIVSKPKGNCYVTCKSLKEVTEIGIKLYNQYSKLIPQNISIDLIE
jgi:hypothetical protein